MYSVYAFQKTLALIFWGKFSRYIVDVFIKLSGSFLSLSFISIESRGILLETGVEGEGVRYE